MTTRWCSTESVPTTRQQEVPKNDLGASFSSSLEVLASMDLRDCSKSSLAMSKARLHGACLANWIVWMSRINKTGAADREQFLHFSNCFGDDVVRLTAVKLIL